MKIMSRSFLVLALGGLAALTAACSSDKPTPAPGDGGGTAGSAGGTPCPNPPDDPADVNLVSDFEDGFARILPNGGRNGGWYPYNNLGPPPDPEFTPDTTCNEMPMVNRCATDAPVATAIEGGHCGSMFAFRFMGSGCKGYAGIGTDLAAPNYPDGGDPTAAICADGGTPTVAHKTPYDMSSYKAISFWGRLGTTAVPARQMIQFKVPMLVDTKIEDGGDCDKTMVKCSASYGRFLPFTTAWTKYTVNLDPTDTKNGIQQESWGKMFTWDPTNVTSIQFQAAASVTFDVWIDDIRLVPKT